MRFNVIFQTLFHPNKSIATAVEKGLLAEAFFISIATMILFVIGDLVILDITGVFMDVRDLIGWFVGSLIIMWIAKCLGGKGSYTDMLIISAFSTVPIFLIGLVYIPMNYVGYYDSTGIVWLILGLALIAAIVFEILFGIRGLSHAYKMSIWKALIAYIPTIIGTIFLFSASILAYL